MSEKLLKGITWGHSRGITPLLAASQRYAELYSDVRIEWHTRSLQQFADHPIEDLVAEYDLLIIDHPWVGRAATLGSVLPLDEYLPASFMDDQSEHSVGYSHHSYQFAGHQWALAIDAATPVASCRMDLLQAAGVQAPDTWAEVLAIGRMGKLAIPAIPIDLLMNFYMFCIAHGSRPFQSDGEVVDESTGISALRTMRELYDLIDPSMFGCNPIAVAELMTKTDQYWYCPFAYGYSNYSREGYARRILTYRELVRMDPAERSRLRSTIGGTGLAISSFSRHRETALSFAQMITDPLFQSTFYVQHGGQPGHRAAWMDDRANRLTNNYFFSVLPAMERGYLRPRYDGYLYFQDRAGQPIQDHLRGMLDETEVLAVINELFQRSLSPSLINRIA